MKTICGYLCLTQVNRTYYMERGQTKKYFAFALFFLHVYSRPLAFSRG